MRPRMGVVRRGGMMLVTVLFAIVILGVLAVAAFQNSLASLRGARAFRESGLALYAAEAGLRKVVGTWPTASVNALTPGDSLDLGWQTLPNRSSYRAVITEVDGGGLQSYLVVVQGRGAVVSRLGARRTIEQVVGGVPIFNYAVFSNSNISVTGANASTVSADSYNSAAGAYSAASADSAGNIAAVGSISTTGTILGSVTAGTTVSLNGGTATGGVTANATGLPSFPTVACPVGGYTPSTSMPAGIGTNYNYNSSTGALSVSGGHNITLTATPSSYYFSSVTLSGGSTLTINSGGQHVDIYVDGTWNTSGGGVVNTSARPTDLGIWGCGANTNSWTISGGSGTYFSVYAPTHPITFSGGSVIYGAVVANGITASGSSRFHYDAALMNTRSSTLAVLQGSWTELTQY